MNIAILQVALTLQELKQLSREFPQLLFLSFPKHELKPISKEHWQRAEVLFGERLTVEDLGHATQLHWIHTPTANTNRICVKEIENKGNILISNTRDDNIFQIGEYVIAGVLAFAKNLFRFKEANRFPAIVWDCKWRNTMWTLKDKVFLQIGMGKAGIEIARRAQLAGMKVWGMDEIRSFHPYCQKHLSLEELHATLHEADVVSVTIPRERRSSFIFGSDELGLMKQDSILSLIGNIHQIDEHALIEEASAEKFRGILLDTYFQTPIPPQSKLWQLPQIIISPEIAPRPRTTAREAFHLFRFNLRQYLHGNFSDMKNLIDPSIATGPDLEE